MYHGSTISMTPNLGSSGLVFSEVSHELPEPKPYEVVIEVAAAGFNPVDYKVASSAGALTPLLNTTGCDVSGRIVERGSEVSAFTIGDKVIGCSGGVGEHYGSATQYLLTDSRYLVAAPKNMSLRKAAAIPLVGITAMDMLDRAQLEPTDTLIILGALGGVGQMLTQVVIARQLVRKIILACGQTNVDKLQDRVINQLSSENVEIEVVDYDSVASGEVTADCVLDTLGNQHFDHALSAIRPLGRIVTINARNTHDLTNAHGKAASIDVVFMLIPWLYANSQDRQFVIKVEDLRQKYHHYLKELVNHVDAGEITLRDIKESPMNQIGDVFNRYASGQQQCKPVLHW